VKTVIGDQPKSGSVGNPSVRGKSKATKR
jgi:hypothetical protein